MKILVANLGSTSFKYRLFDLTDESRPTQLARGGIDRIGQSRSRCITEIGGQPREVEAEVPDHGQALRICLDELTKGENACLKSVSDVAAVGFKAVHAGALSGVRRVDGELLRAMDDLADVAPAHNPPYTAAMRSLSVAFPDLPLIAALETDFHSTIPDAHRRYAIPREWAEDFGVIRWGFHGASHRFIAKRIGEIARRTDLRAISCHLGGSSSLCATRNGRSIATTMGMSPQSGLPQNNRAGDFDCFALPYLMRKTGKSLDELLKDLAGKSGLAALSGTSGDLRDIEQAAAAGNTDALLALDLYVASIRQALGGLMALLGGCDTVVFTGGIGENSQLIREHVCQDMEWAGMELDAGLNASVRGEGKVSRDSSRVEIWTIPTNEEVVVARQTADLLRSESGLARQTAASHP